MTERSAVPATFVIERTYAATPARAFAAWADPAVKEAWFTGSKTHSPAYALDFRVGGREVTRGGPPGGAVYSYEATYQDIVEQRALDGKAADEALVTLGKSGEVQSDVENFAIGDKTHRIRVFKLKPST